MTSLTHTTGGGSSASRTSGRRHQQTSDPPRRTTSLSCNVTPRLHPDVGKTSEIQKLATLVQKLRLPSDARPPSRCALCRCHGPFRQSKTVNVTLLACAADRRAIVLRAAVAPLLLGDRYLCLPGPQQQIRRTLLQRSAAGTDEQTDGYRTYRPCRDILCEPCKINVAPSRPIGL